jgi:hypothetical protein
MQDGHGNLFANVQASDRPYPALGLVELRRARINA